ncbi:hypothetical protein FKZ61_022905 [Litorilinea aerophila]|uniref:Uncharacterized protein n=1 Tax=Litorilinea aerophila TaxID=1204385 RepID=A0A540V8P1_9CHLR|nr:hypothetical protein [Litorilinea aerophila]MCC9078948.1 hypothetical protein [Litorilinea aerophila]
MKRSWLPIFLLFLMWSASACTLLSPPSTGGAPAEAGALVWEGDPFPEDGEVECRRLELTAAGEAFIGPCDQAGAPVEGSVALTETWTQMVQRFAPFEQQSDGERLVFQGTGTIAGPAWVRAIQSWARTTYQELASGRVSASGRTVMSWWLGEVPEQPGNCRHLVVLAHGYAYHNITPCQGGAVVESHGGWLSDEEWDVFDGWFYSRAPLYQENNYFAGLGNTPMDEAETAALAEWAAQVYARLGADATAAARPGVPPLAHLRHG